MEPSVNVLRRCLSNNFISWFYALKKLRAKALKSKVNASQSWPDDELVKKGPFYASSESKERMQNWKYGARIATHSPKIV